MPMSSPLQVDERATGIARIDRGVGLDEILIAVGVDARARQAADDSGRDGVLQSERIADRDDEVADLELGRIAERRFASRPSACTLEHRDIRRRISADDLGRQDRARRCSVTVISLAFSTTCALVRM